MTTTLIPATSSIDALLATAALAAVHECGAALSALRDLANTGPTSVRRVLYTLRITFLNHRRQVEVQHMHDLPWADAVALADVLNNEYTTLSTHATPQQVAA